MSISFVVSFYSNPTFHTLVHLLFMNQPRPEFCRGGVRDVIGDSLVLRKIPSWRALSGTLSWCSLLGSCDCLGVSREPVVFRKRLLRAASGLPKEY